MKGAEFGPKRGVKTGYTNEYLKKEYPYKQSCMLDIYVSTAEQYLGLYKQGVIFLHT
jgi:hypothetical protein